MLAKINPTPLALLRRLAIAFATVAHTAGGAAAQAPIGPPPPAEMFKKMCNDMDALFAARMAFVQTRVAPTPAQTAEWEAFVTSSRAMLGAIKATCNSPDAVPPSPKDPMAILIFRERGARDRADLYRAERAAVERFMKVLSPQQQQSLGEAMLPPPHVGPMAGPIPGLPPL